MVTAAATRADDLSATRSTRRMREAMRDDPRVILIGEDIAGGAEIDHLINDDAWGGPMGVTKGLVQEFGRERVLDTPITEAGFIGAAVGAAATGLRPVAELMFVDFFGCCMDQIFNQGAKLRYMFGGKAKCPLVIRTMIGAGRQRRGAALADATTPCSPTCPASSASCPRTPSDAKGLLLTAIRDDDPVMFFENKVLYAMKGEVPEGDERHPARRGRHQARGHGRHDRRASPAWCTRRSTAAEALADEGIEAEVIDPRTLSPLDEDTILESVAQDAPPGRRRRGQPALQRRDRHRGAGRRQGLRLPRRADQDRDRAPHAGPVQPAAGAGICAEPREDRRRRSGRPRSRPQPREERHHGHA